LTAESLAAVSGSAGFRRERELKEPDIGRMSSDYLQIVNERSTGYWTRMRQNIEGRYALWPNQSSDGRKWVSEKNKEPFPWKGATDSRVLMIDGIVNENVAVLMESLRRMKCQVRPTRPGFHAAMGRNLTVLMQWLMQSAMEEWENEFEILANLVEERGAAAMGVFWWREEVRRAGHVTIEQLDAMPGDLQAVAEGRQPDPAIMPISMVIADPLQEEAAAERLLDVLEVMSTEDHGWTAKLTMDRLKKVVRDLRTTGEAEFPQIVVQNDRPTVVAMVINEDLFLPPEQTDRRYMRHAYRRELVTEAQLEERIRTMDWNPKWVEWMVTKMRGNTSYATGASAYDPTRVTGREWLDTRNLFEVVWGWRREYDADGIPRINQTAFSPFGKPEPGIPAYASTEPLDYDHGQYPFIVFKNESRTRRVDDARGLGETTFTWQQLIKRKIDAQADRGDLATLPPMHHPPDEEPDHWGPGSKIETNHPEKFGYMSPPPADQGDVEVITLAREIVNQYAGRLNASGSNRVEAGTLGQAKVNRWLRSVREVCKMVLQLCQQYLPDETYLEVTGGQQPEPLHLSRADIQGEFMVSCTFNAGLLDSEVMQEIMALMQQVLALDSTGRVDRDAVMELAMDMVSPGLSSRLLRPAEQASMQEAADELKVYSQMLNGVGTDVKPGQAYQLRLQTLMKAHQMNPRGQRIASEDPQVAELLKTRAKQLQFNIEQKQQNPQIGRLYGTAPVGADTPGSQAHPVKRTVWAS
jgi:hypothetical protein